MQRLGPRAGTATGSLFLTKPYLAYPVGNRAIYIYSCTINSRY